jgi:FkbM family methyltransferase
MTIREVVINGEWPLLLPDSSASEWEGNMLYHHNQWEMIRLQTLERLVGDGARVLYVGAYKGDMPALMQTWGDTEMVLVEGTAGFWPLIQETWEANGLRPPVGMFSGLASRVTTSPLTTHELRQWPARSEPFVEGTTGFAHLAESGGHFPEITLDELCYRLTFWPDIVTMDIEGSELEALYGAMHLIQDVRPTFLISVHPEFMFHSHGTYERELHDLLRNNGYKEQWLDYDHEHHWLYTP